ncbi:MAG: pyridoxal-phosphate dependent enzyme, partial [Candidatus Kariarchaeaceae archaeon]
MVLLTHLECTACGKKLDHSIPQKLCSCGKVLYPRYDLEKAKETLTKDNLTGRKNNIWRMSEIMPCSLKYQFSLGEGGTPLLDLNEKDGVKIYAKEEGLNPTGSFKIRGLCAAVSRGIELGINEFVIPTAGNAG